jgi:hypothetical protein
LHSALVFFASNISPTKKVINISVHIKLIYIYIVSLDFIERRVGLW